MSHSLSRGPSPLAGSSFSLGSSGLSSKVTGRRGSLLPRQAAASVASRKRGKRGRAEGDARGGAQGGAAGRHKPARDDTCRNCGQAHVAQAEEPALFMAHASIELPLAAPAVAALLHLDEPKAHALLGDSSGNNKTDGWCLDTSATHHMTG